MCYGGCDCARCMGEDEEPKKRKKPTYIRNWEYLKKHLKEDGWGQDGPHRTPAFNHAVVSVEEALFRLERLGL